MGMKIKTIQFALYFWLMCNLYSSAGAQNEGIPLMLDLTDTTSTQQNQQEEEKFNKSVSLIHYFDHFEKPYPLSWHMTSLEAKWKSKKITYMGFVNYGQLLTNNTQAFQKWNMQYRADVYPLIGENNYAYLSYGISGSNIFPTHQVRGIFYHQFGKGWEESLGFYYMHWDKGVTIYTGSIAKYIKHYWISLRPFIHFEKGEINQSYLLFIRRYFHTPEDFVNLMIGYGSSPDNQAYIYQYEDIYKLRSFNVQLNYQENLNNWLLRAGVGVKIEEFKQKEHRNRLHVEFGISYKL
jgi:YaiO family outer membrane protein